MRLPSLKFLKTFQVAARLQSFKAAAEELFVTPSAISHQIKALEEHLGVSLFQRGVRTLTLTDAGANYLEHINDIFSKLESVTEQLQVRYGRTIIRLNVPSFFANELLCRGLHPSRRLAKKPIFASRRHFLRLKPIRRRRICPSSWAQAPGTVWSCMSCSRRTSSRRVLPRFCSTIPSIPTPI